MNKSDEYNKEPVYYCGRCLSLRIKTLLTPGMEYCDSCGCTDIKSSSIEYWEQLYESKTGIKYLNN